MPAPLKSKKHAVKRLVVPFHLKAAADPASHTFEGLAAVIGQKDLGNDIIEPGAFTDTLSTWKKGNDALPLLNSHNQYDIMSALGQLISAKETKDGLWSQWEVIDGPEGDAVMTRLTPSKITGRAIIGKMSIGYIPIKWEIEQPEGTSSYWDQIRHLTEVELKECSLVLFPMAPGAAIDATTVKSFLLSAQATEAKSLDALAKAELRRLATRIGILLQKSESTDPEVKGKKKPKDEVPPVKPKADPEHPGDEADDDDDLDVVADRKADPEHPGQDDEDDDDLDVVADLTKETDAMVTCSDCDGTGMISGEDCKTCGGTGMMPKKADAMDLEIKKNEPFVYQEALQHRLAKTLLAHKVKSIGEPK